MVDTSVEIGQQVTGDTSADLRRLPIATVSDLMQGTISMRENHQIQSSEAEAAARVGSGFRSNLSSTQDDDVYRDLALHVAQEAEGEQEAQEEPSPAIIP